MKVRAYWLMHIAIILWGFTGIFGKAINMNFGSIVWFRMIMAAAGLLVFILYRKKFRIIKGTDLVQISFTGFIVMIHWLSFYAAIKLSNVSITLSCFASITFFTAILDPLINKRKLDRVEILLSLLVLAGIYIIFQAQELYLYGIILALASAALGALFTIQNKQFLNKYDSGLITFYELIAGWFAMVIIGWLNLPFIPVSLSIPSSIDLMYLLLLSIVCTTVAFTISLEALKVLNPFTLNLAVNLEPVYSIILAFLFFNEYELLSSGFYAGTFLILAAVAIHVLHQRKISQAGFTEK